MAVPRNAAGFSLIELLIVAGLVSVLSAIAIPGIAAGMRRYALNNAAQQIASTIRSARYTAVSKNKTVRVRFNCPATDQFRMVEFVGSPGVDDAVDRCSLSAYPEADVEPDVQPDVDPDVDGPVLLVPSGTELGTVEDLEINTEGRVVALAGCPVCTKPGGTVSIAIENGYESQTINVSNAGQVDVDPAVPISE